MPSPYYVAQRATALVGRLRCSHNVTRMRQRCSVDDGVPATRLVLFAARRTGSSLFVNLLRRHPKILMHGELFHVREITDPDDGYAGRGKLPPADTFNVRRAQPQHLLRFVGCHAEGRSVVGLKIFRDHLRPSNWWRVTGWCDVCVVLQRDE